MNLRQPFYLHGEHFAIDLPGARALFTTRRGGSSRGAYASLNLGRWTDDDQQAVQRNRDAVQELVGAPLAVGRQVHGPHVHRVASAAENGATPVEADGQATNASGLAPTVLVADCLPVVVAAPGAVAVLHAGWRGLATGVIEHGVRAVRELGGTEPLSAAIGPGAGPCCYEVGEDVHAAFDDHPEAHRGANLDLKAIASDHLRRAGVDRIHDIAMCTICSDRSLFFSHRRDDGLTGRQAGIAWLS